MTQRVADRGSDLHAELPRPVSERFALLLRHERARHHDGRGSHIYERQRLQIRFHQTKRVRAAAGHDDDDGLVADFELVAHMLRILDRVHVADIPAVAHLARQHTVDLVLRRGREHVRRSVDQDRVVIALEGVVKAFALPDGAGYSGIIDDVAHTQDHSRGVVERSNEAERRNELAVRAAGHVVDEDEIGMEPCQHFPIDGRPHRLDQSIAGQQAARPEDAGAHLHHRRQLDEIDALLKIEEGSDRRIDNQEN